MNSAAAQTGYKLPPKEVVDIIDAKPEPSVSWSPDGRWMLFLQNDAMPGIEDLGRRMLRLAGLRIDPAADSSFQVDFIRGLTLRSVESGSEIIIPAGENVRISGISWSHRSNAFVYSVVTNNGTELWCVDVQTTNAAEATDERLSTVLDGFDWMPDGRSILCCTVPSDRGRRAKAPVAPGGLTFKNRWKQVPYSHLSGSPCEPL